MTSLQEPKTELIVAAEKFVRDELKGQDGSHDIHHILRVKRTALSLAIEEGIADLELIVLAALLHDIKDWKYSGSETAGSEAVRAFLDQYEYAKVDTVVKIIERIGYKTELGRQDKQKSSDADVANVDGSQETWMFPELAVVQDADRLDAIGAIGIARTFCYGGARNRALYDPEDPPIKDITKEQYKKSNAPTINHFYEKLLRLKGLMKTEAGRKRAEERHKYMLDFLDQFYAEWDGEK